LKGAPHQGKTTFYDYIFGWLEKHARYFWVLLLMLAVGLRLLLIYYSPRPDGYTYDFYFEGVEHLDTTGRLPIATDCWQCYHPALVPHVLLLGLPLLIGVAHLFLYAFATGSASVFVS
jgi:hypothetical protein